MSGLLRTESQGDRRSLAVQVADSLHDAISDGRSMGNSHEVSLLTAAIYTALDGNAAQIGSVSDQLRSGVSERETYAESDSFGEEVIAAESSEFITRNLRRSKNRDELIEIGESISSALGDDKLLLEGIETSLSDVVAMAGGETMTDMCYTDCPPKTARPFRLHQGTKMCDHLPPHFQ